METFQDFLKAKGIDDAAFNKMAEENPAEVARLHNEFSSKQISDLRELVEKATTKSEVEEIKGFLSELEVNSDAYKALSEEVAELKQNQTSFVGKKQTLSEEVKSSMEILKSLAKGDTKKEHILKTLVQRSAIADNDQAYDLPEIGQIATRKIALTEVFPTINISSSKNDNGVIRYYDWDEATINRAAAVIAEGDIFPESTAAWVKRTIAIKKIGDTIPVTEEFFEDESMFAAELQRFLEINVKLQEELQIATGDDTGQNLKGILTSVDEFVPVPSTIQDASVYDLVVKMAEGITSAGGSKYSPDVILANRSVINQMKLKKDAENRYIVPPFVSADGKYVDGILVIECNVFGTNELILADRKFATIYAKTGYEVSSGLAGTQFLEDEMTLKIRRRLAFLIKESDKGGFSKCTDITGALTTLTV